VLQINKSANDVLHNVVHRISSGVLWCLLSLFKMKILKCKLMKLSYTEFQQNLWKGLWNIREVLRKLGFIVDKFGWKSEFHNNFWWKLPVTNFNSICKLDYGIHYKSIYGLMSNKVSLKNECIYKLELSNNLHWRPPISNFNNICETVYWVLGKVHLWPSTNHVSLWISMAENLSFPTALAESLPQRIWRTYVQRYRRRY
jgi:hypothetical protein